MTFSFRSKSLPTSLTKSTFLNQFFLLSYLFVCFSIISTMSSTFYTIFNQPKEQRSKKKFVFLLKQVEMTQTKVRMPHFFGGPGEGICQIDGEELPRDNVPGLSTIYFPILDCIQAVIAYLYDISSLEDPLITLGGTVIASLHV